MPSFDDLILFLTCRIAHQTDFAFSHNKGDIANSLRAKIAAGGLTGTISKVEQFEIDDDGDIAISTDRCSIYLDAESILIAGWSTSPGDLAVGRDTEPISQALEFFLRERGQLRPEQYQVRLFFSIRTLPRFGLARSAATRTVGLALTSVLGSNLPHSIDTFQISAKFRTEPFADTVELEGSPRDFQVRFLKEATPDTFESYKSFLAEAGLHKVVQEARPLIDPLITDASKLLGRVFKETKSK